MFDIIIRRCICFRCKTKAVYSISFIILWLHVFLHNEQGATQQIQMHRGGLVVVHMKGKRENPCQVAETKERIKIIMNIFGKFTFEIAFPRVFPRAPCVWCVSTTVASPLLISRFGYRTMCLGICGVFVYTLSSKFCPFSRHTFSCLPSRCALHFTNKTVYGNEFSSSDVRTATIILHLAGFIRCHFTGVSKFCETLLPTTDKFSFRVSLHIFVVLMVDILSFNVRNKNAFRVVFIHCVHVCCLLNIWFVPRTVKRAPLILRIPHMLR